MHRIYEFTGSDNIALIRIIIYYVNVFACFFVEKVEKMFFYTEKTEGKYCEIQMNMQPLVEVNKSKEDCLE